MEENYEGELFSDGPKTSKSKESSFSSWRIPRSNKLAEQSRQSTPINIPKRSIMFRRSSSLNVCVEEEEDEEEEGETVPPHEWLARKLERSQICSGSVCEGAGRTLKGRDQSKVRDAVLRRTGYLQ